MNKHEYLVGIIGQTDCLTYAASEKEAQQLAISEKFTADPNALIGIWKLQSVGRLTKHLQWNDPSPEPKSLPIDKHRQLWTKTEDALLERLIFQGYSATQIARKLGRTVRAIQLRQYRANLQR